jgi:hypothetical protein
MSLYDGLGPDSGITSFVAKRLLGRARVSANNSAAQATCHKNLWLCSCLLILKPNLKRPADTWQ